jgi:hypothetical protein
MIRPGRGDRAGWQANSRGGPLGELAGGAAARLPSRCSGRKNHYGSRSERGSRVAAPFYSLIESAKPAGVEPRAYPGETTRQAIRCPGAVTLGRDLKSPEA